MTGFFGFGANHASRALRRHLRREVRAHSTFWRSVIDRAGGIGSNDDVLGRIPVTRFGDISDWGDLVLRPSAESIASDGPRLLAIRLAFARAFGRQASFGRRVIDPAYKPLVWLAEGGALIGCSSVDLDHLAELGRRWLERAGVQQDDVLVSLVEPGPNLVFQELSLGARRGGLSAISLQSGISGAELATLHPTVLAGSHDALREALATADEAGTPLREVRTVLLIDAEPPGFAAKASVAELLPPDAEVVAAWAPPGVRSLWAECRGGSQFHTSPGSELVEEIDGELVWTGIGWAGTALVRWGTGTAGSVVEDSCPTCGREGARIVVAREPRLAAEPAPESSSSASTVLDAESLVRWWDIDELDDGSCVVTLGVDDPEWCGDLVRRLDPLLDGVAQFVVVSAD